MFKKLFLKHLIFNKRIKILKNKISLYNDIDCDVDIYGYQISKFNEVWKYSYENFKFYKEWKKRHDLPGTINSIDDLKLFPDLTKKDIQNNYEIIFDDLKKIQIISTGGSSGEPTKYPTNKKQKDNEYANTYLGKYWWGVEPLDSLLMFWGHSHLFGNGLKGKFNSWKRSFFDYLINTIRFSAYNMTDSTLVKNTNEIKHINPKAIIGYTSLISKMSKTIKANNLSIGDKTNLRGVICTSETVSDYDIDIISDAFNCSVIIEYGMAECGVIAYSKKHTDNLVLFWDSFIATENHNSILNITTLYDRAFPLINYKTDDIVITKKKYKKSVLSFKKIVGRSNDVLKIKVNEEIIEVHSELFTHLLKAISGIINFQITQKKDLSIFVRYVCNDKNHKVKELFIYELEREYLKVDVEQFIFLQVEEIEKTISGKTKWVVIEDA